MNKQQLRIENIVEFVSNSIESDGIEEVDLRKLILLFI